MAVDFILVDRQSLLLLESIFNLLSAYDLNRDLGRPRLWLAFLGILVSVWRVFFDLVFVLRSLDYVSYNMHNLLLVLKTASFRFDSPTDAIMAGPHYNKI